MHRPSRYRLNRKCCFQSKERRRSEAGSSRMRRWCACCCRAFATPISRLRAAMPASTERSVTSLSASLKRATTQLVGHRVVGEINAGCGKCDLCRAGDPRHCASRTVLGIVGRDGAHAEFLQLPARKSVACSGRTFPTSMQSSRNHSPLLAAFSSAYRSPTPIASQSSATANSDYSARKCVALTGASVVPRSENTLTNSASPNDAASKPRRPKRRGETTRESLT